MKYILGFTIILIVQQSCQKKEKIERNSIIFKENIDTVRAMIHKMNRYLGELPPSADDKPHNYYIEKSILYINGNKYDETIIQSESNDKTALFLKKNPEFVKIAYRLYKNGITANIPYINCKNALFYYRPTIEQHRGDSRFIVIMDSIRCNYLVGNDTILDTYKDLYLIADKSNPIYPTE